MKRTIYYLCFFMSLFLFSISVVKAADVAEIDGSTFTSLSNAINAVTEPNTTITLLVDRKENITIGKGKSIILDLNGHILENNGNKTVITNNGDLTITNGTVTSAASNGMINNNSEATLTINDGSYIATGSRQVIYNNKGTLTISGTAYLESASDERATIHNLNNGIVNITGGTIVSNNLYAVYNDKGTMNIGIKDELYNQSSPVIQGKTYGVIANNKINVYDGIIKGGTYHIGTANSASAPIVNDDIGETKINDFEELSEKVLDNEVISGTTYNTFTYFLDSANIIKITFNPNGGTVSPTSKKLFIGNTIGTLPEPQKQDNKFDGWFTSSTGGTQINENTIPNTDIAYYAHWTYVDPNSIAYVEGVGLMSLEDAFATGGNIRLEKDVIITSELFMNKASTLDLNGHIITLKNKSITIKEEVTIDDKSSSQTGKITSDASFTIIVGSSSTATNGHLIHKGGTIEGLGAYGAIRNYESVEIDGGTVQGTATETGFVIYNQNELIMTSGTIHSTNGRAIQVYTNSTFTMNGGLVKTDAASDQTVNLYGDCSATINGGTIEGLSNETAGISMFGNTTLEVNGGTIKGSSFGIAGNGKESSANANITINAGNIIATEGVGIYLPQRNSTTIINDGNISGSTGIEIRASDLLVNGGNITGTSDTYEIKADTNGTTSKGAAIAVSQHNSKQPINVIINDGNFKAKVPLCEVNPLNNPDEKIKLVTISVNQGNFESTGDEVIIVENLELILPFVTGGLYSLDPTTYVKDGYGVVKIEDNKYEVTKIHNIIIDSKTAKVVSVDNNKYPYKSIVELNIKEGLTNGATIEIKKLDGTLIKINNNKFTMPDSDVVIRVIYPKSRPLNPLTCDKVLSFVLLGLVSLIGFLMSIIYYKKT